MYTNALNNALIEGNKTRVREILCDTGRVSEFVCTETGTATVNAIVDQVLEVKKKNPETNVQAETVDKTVQGKLIHFMT